MAFSGKRYRKNSYLSLSEATFTDQPEPESTEAGSKTSKSVVIVAIDWSRQAWATFNWYLDHLNKPDHDLILVHVADPPYVSNEQAMYMSSELWEEMLSERNKQLLKLTNKYATIMRKQKVSGCFRAIFHKNIGKALVEEVKDENACLVVLGTRGTSDSKRSFLGSVSNYVLHNAICPVMVCSEGTPDVSPSLRDKVLVYF